MVATLTTVVSYRYISLITMVATLTTFRYRNLIRTSVPKRDNGTKLSNCSYHNNHSNSSNLSNIVWSIIC